MSAQDLYKKACDLVELGNFDYAIELFRQVLRNDPQYPDARKALRGTERRRLQEKGGSFANALLAPVRGLLTSIKGTFGGPRKKLEVFEDYLEKSPNSYWALMNAAAAAKKCELRDEYVMLYTDAIRLKPNDKRGLRVVSDALMEAGVPQEALTYLRRLSDMLPSDRDLLREVRDLEATQHMTSHQMEEAGSFRDMIRDKDEADRLEKSRRMAVTMDDLRGRVPEAEKGLEEHPDNPNRILGLAQLYVDTGQLKKARDLLKEKQELLPDNYEIREKLGDVQLIAYENAIAAADEKLAVDAQDAEARGRREDLTKRRNALAFREYTWRAEQHPTDKMLQIKLGRVYFDAGQYDRAIAAYQSTVQDSRLAVESARMLGMCFLRKKQYDLSLSQFKTAIERHPEMDEEGKELLYYEAQVYEEMGSSAEALNVYKKIYSQDITFRDVAQKVEALSG